MKKNILVGLTYDLVSDYPVLDDSPEDLYGEFDSEETVSALENALVNIGYSVQRIGNINHLVKFLASDKRVDVVFNIAEGLWGRNREGQIPALLEAYRIPYTFSDPITLSLSLDKAFTKSLWQRAGLPVSPFYVVEELAYYKAPIKAGLEFPLFVKPVREGSSKGVGVESIVETAGQLKVQVERVISTYHQPAIVEEFLPGREFTVAVLGHDSTAKVLGILEVTKVKHCKVNGFVQKSDWATYGSVAFKPLDEPLLQVQLEEICVQAYQVVGCRDAARLDLRMDKHGQLQLMEINPLSGLSNHSALPILARNAGLSFEMLIETILQGAIERGASE